MSKFRTLWQNYRWSLLVFSVLLSIVMVSVLAQSVAAEMAATQALNLPEDDPGVPQAPPDLPINYWSYSVKIVCDDYERRERNTVINIFNPSQTDTLVGMRSVLTAAGQLGVVRPSLTGGTIWLNPAAMVLPGENATAIDCIHLNLDPSIALKEGFVNIVSEKPLDIVAVYIRSYFNDELGGYVFEKDENVEIEHIPGRYVMNGEAQSNGWEQP